MNKNHMEEVAKMLGVEIGEKFDVCRDDGKKISDSPYYIDEKYLVNCNGDSQGFELALLLNGTHTIKKTILNEKEKAYLGGVLRPFKDRVGFITKFENSCEEEYINIGIEGDENINFPNFKANTMYKGMELYKHYTLKELGLFE